MVLARLLMVTSAYIIRKNYFSLAIYVLDKTLFLSTWKIQCKLPPKTKRFCPLVLK